MIIIDLLKQPWHWAFSGFMISLIMFLLLFYGKSFGMSSTLRTTCAMVGAGKKIGFFNIDWKAQRWNLLFAIGAVFGGYIAANFLASPEPVAISTATIDHLESLGLQYPQSTKDGMGYIPMDLFSWENLSGTRGLTLLIGGGFLVGFGARYAGGCTSGHAISGLSNLQLPSLIAVIGFFVGGLTMTHFLLPIILNF